MIRSQEMLSADIATKVEQIQEVPWSLPENIASHRLLVLKLFSVALGVRLIDLCFTHNTGTDAWARYQIALTWLNNPWHVPSTIWLPLHFWLLGSVLMLWKSELAARLLTVLLGSLTVPPLYGIVRRVFDGSVAVYATLTLIFLGLHVGYSGTTSSEVPTVFFVVWGVYSWLRYRSDGEGKWLVIAGAAFSAASLCRFEPWIYIPVLGVLTLDFSRGMKGALETWPRAAAFLLLASVGAAGWAVFSYVKWGDWLASAHGTALINASNPLNPQHPTPYTILSVPGGLVASLTPIIVILALIAIADIFREPFSTKWMVAMLAVVLTAAHWLNAILHTATMARYALMYNWLWLPLAFYALEKHAGNWKDWLARRAFVSTFAFFVIWQGLIIAVAQRAPCNVADRFGSISATLPLRCDLRHLISWVKGNVQDDEAVVLDNFSYEAADMIRFCHLRQQNVFSPPYMAGPADVKNDLASFVINQHPRLLVYEPRGPLGRTFMLGNEESVVLKTAEVQLHLYRIWQGQEYRVYAIE